MNDVKTTYREVEILYSEDQDKWTCELFTKPAENLRVAKERIDKKLDTEKKVPFKRFKAFVESFGYGSKSWPLVEVTNITDDGREAWCCLGKERRKVGSSYGSDPAPVYPEAPKNSALVAEIHEHEQAITNLKDKINKAEENLQIWKP